MFEEAADGKAASSEAELGANSEVAHACLCSPCGLEAGRPDQVGFSACLSHAWRSCVPIPTTSMRARLWMSSTSLHRMKVLQQRAPSSEIPTLMAPWRLHAKQI